MPIHRPRTVHRIAGCYPTRWLRGYTIGKINTDPAYPAVRQRVAETNLPLLDIGCGVGVCAAYLREYGYDAPILGIDPVPEKIEMAQRVAQRYPAVRFEVGDGENLPAFSGHVCMLDVLHYFPPDKQPGVLQSLADRVAPGGWCLIRTTPDDGSWRYRCTLFEERFAQRVRWMQPWPTWFPTAESIVAPFERAGFSVETKPLWGWTPFNSYWYAFRRPGA